MLHGLVAICPEVRKGGYSGSHWPKQRRASSLLGVLRGQRSFLGARMFESEGTVTLAIRDTCGYSWSGSP